MLSITSDLLALSQAQREALADFIRTFPASEVVDSSEDEGSSLNSVTFPNFSDDQEPLSLDQMRDKSYEIGSGEDLPAFDAPLPPGIVPSIVHSFAAPLPLVMPLPPLVGIASPSNLDKNGMPWDERIHAGSKAKTQDGSWRYKRGLDDGSKTQVEAELRAVMGLPAPGGTITVGDANKVLVAAGVAPIPVPISAAFGRSIVPPPPAAPAAVASITTSNPVVSSPVAVMPPPPVPAASGNAFLSLVLYAGAKTNEGKLTDAEVEQACLSVGVPKLTLMTNRTDLCPQVESALRLLVSTR